MVWLALYVIGAFAALVFYGATDGDDLLEGFTAGLLWPFVLAIMLGAYIGAVIRRRWRA